ncbi:GNAT family N-acetyltransferase [candidate division LCP-89 bacterium B3_LCP]|uniref:GNAT family N-acetyltransferase n=1 Tax=candidate division LCP-89 bacterium B3_LCP TaxID=2012998 RepID=A0A532UZV0_UNCL8|nr:MAG: GNAT family N-acetyltransferase [candidate division LCP-89 bacterium B3_LCP]
MTDKSNRMITYQWYTFDQLNVEALYQILSMRQDIFIVEQNCVYRDIDHLDQSAWHLVGRDTDENVVGYLRVLPPGKRFAEPAIGRVTTAHDERKKGIGEELMRRGIEKAEKLFPGSAIRLSAQVAATGLYERCGFSSVGKPYDEDGIPHIEMVRIPSGDLG